MTGLLPMRDYQREAVGASEQAWEGGMRRPALVLPTGAGKTVVFAHAGQRFRKRTGKRILYLAHRTELIEQAAARLHDVMPGERIGIVKAARNETLAPHVVASVQTLRQVSRRAQLLDVGLVVVDEAHHAAADSYVAVLAHFGALSVNGSVGYRGNNAVALGVTATMVRGDDRALGEVWQDVVYSRSIADMIRDGWLVRPRGKRVRVADLDLRGVRKLAGDYSGKQLGAALEDSLAPEAVAKAVAEHAPDRPAILFAPLVSTAELFCEALREAGFTAEVVSGETPPDVRRSLLEDFRARRVQILCNAMLFTEGTDLPLTSCIIIARPTLNPGLYVQMVGRALRPDIGKDDCLVLDVVGATQKHRLTAPVELFGTESLFAMLDEDELADQEDGEQDAIELEEAIDGAGGGRGSDVPDWRDGPLVTEDVDLFHGSDSVWLQTAAGVWFLAPGERYIAVVPGRFGGYDVVSMHQTRQGDSRWIAEAVQSLAYAMAWAEDDVTPAERSRVTRAQSWRATRPDAKLRRKAAQAGIEITKDMTVGEINNRAAVIAGTWRIDSYLPAYLRGQ
jgi:superfamily II DNA or RNA helicase